MPKRRHEDNNDYRKLRKKLKKIEQKLRRRERRRDSYSGTENSSSEDIISVYSTPEMNILEDNSALNKPDQLNTGEQLEAGLQDSNNIEIPIILDEGEVLEIFGADPTATSTYGADIQKDLAVRLEHITTCGLSKDDKKDIITKHLIPNNARMIGAPILNPEMKVAISDIVSKRDNAIYNKQKQLASAISSLGQAISMMVSQTSGDKNPALLKLLMDTIRNLCDVQHADTLTRRNYVLNSVKKDMKDHLTSTKVDATLFGENLGETLKNAKAITKSGADLRPASNATNSQHPVAKRSYLNKQRTPLNQKGPAPTYRQTGPQRTREPVEKNYRQMKNSSRQSRGQQRTWTRGHRT